MKISLEICSGDVAPVVLKNETFQFTLVILPGLQFEHIKSKEKQ